MPNDIDWDDEDQSGSDGFTEQVNDNKTIKALRAKIKADEAERNAMATQLETLMKSERERTVREVLEKKGVNPKVAPLVIKTVDEVTEENVDAWLKANAEALNLAPVTQTQTEDTSENFDDLSQQDAFTSQAVSPGTGENIKSKIDSFKSFEEIDAWAKSLQPKS